jgi:hypothetical protein
MSKVIKLKESDLEKIIENVLNEENSSDSITSNPDKYKIAVNPETNEIFFVMDADTDDPQIYSTGTFFKK